MNKALKVIVIVLCVLAGAGGLGICAAMGYNIFVNKDMLCALGVYEYIMLTCIPLIYLAGIIVSFCKKVLAGGITMCVSSGIFILCDYLSHSNFPIMHLGYLIAPGALMLVAGFLNLLNKKRSY